MTTLRWYLLGLLTLFGAYVALEYYRPKPLDWTPTLSNKDKIPYGTYALYDVLPQLLGTDSVESVRLPVYNQFFDQDEDEDALEFETEPDSTSALASDAVVDTTATAAAPGARDTTAYPPDSLALTANPVPDSAATADSEETDEDEAEDPDAAVRRRRASYVFINREFLASKAETAALLTFVAAGNDVFIAADAFAGGGRLQRQRTLLDTLGVRLTEPAQPALPRAGGVLRPDSVRIQLSNRARRGVGLRVPATAIGGYFEVKAGRPGATLATDAQGQAVFVDLRHGRGHFYLCSVPLAFSNYYVLRPSSRPFALAALGYLPAGRPVWWDEYQKQGRVGEQSLLRVLLAHESLRYAYYLLLLTAVLFVLVEARRRQRIIPVIKPLPNTTLLFTRTVASLYRQGSNHGRIADKKVALFLDYLRTRFQEPAPDLADAAFRERLSQKAGLPLARVEELVRLVNFARTAPVVSDQQLLSLSQAIRSFRQETK